MAKKRKITRQKLVPMLLCVAVIAADQLSKFIVEKTIPRNTIGAAFFGDFFRIVHVTNTGAAFSMGSTLSDFFRFAAFCIIPLAVLTGVVAAYFVTEDFSAFQRWMVAGLVGGGYGNLYDRFFRPNGVVDFLDVKFYGLFGLERWPTFNIADSAIMVCAIMLVISMLCTTVGKKNTDKIQEGVAEK